MNLDPALISRLSTVYIFAIGPRVPALGPKNVVQIGSNLPYSERLKAGFTSISRGSKSPGNPGRADHLGIAEVKS